MSETIFHYIEFTQYYLLLTCLLALFFYNATSIGYRFLLLILMVCLFNEGISTTLLYLKKDIGYLSAVNVMVHNGLWIILLGKLSKYITWHLYFVVGYIAANCINIMHIEGIESFDSAFVSGAFIYLSLFLVESFIQLKNENFSFFGSNNYILLFAPVLFFFGISFVCGFKSSAFAHSKVIGELSIYQFIGYFSNIIYYTLINFYIYREKK